MCVLRRVLVVDDHPHIRSVLEGTLGLEGYDVRTAGHGRAALELLPRFPPCLILLDLMMPVLNGWDFVPAYRQTERADARIVVMTASGEARRHAAALHAHGHVAKPFDLDAILLLVEHHVRAHSPIASPAR